MAVCIVLLPLILGSIIASITFVMEIPTMNINQPTRALSENATGSEPLRRSALREWAESVVRALILVLIVKTFVVQAFFIPSGSMIPTFRIGDFLLVDKVSPLFVDPSPGEVIVFEYPVDPTKNFIKRVVGVPGDRLAHIDDTLIRNGEALREPYTQYLQHSSGLAIRDGRSFPERTVERNTLWVMGDNRNDSYDSRFWGPLSDWRLVGKAWGIYWPILRRGIISHQRGTRKTS